MCLAASARGWLSCLLAVDADIKSRIEFKVGKVLEKLGHDATSCHVTLKVLKNPEGEVHHSMKQDSHIGEVSVVLKGGAVVNVSDSSSDLETTGKRMHS